MKYPPAIADVTVTDAAGLGTVVSTKGPCKSVAAVNTGELPPPPAGPVGPVEPLAPPAPPGPLYTLRSLRSCKIL